MMATLVATSGRALAVDPTATPAPPPTAEQEAFRASVETMLDGLGGVIATMKSDPAMSTGLAAGTSDPAAQLASVKQQVADMTSTELDQLKAGLDQYPQWPQMPQVLLGAVETFINGAPVQQSSALRTTRTVAGSDTNSPSASRLMNTALINSSSGTFTSDCGSAGSAPDEFIATEVANEVQSAAQAAMLGVPGVVAIFFVDVPTGVKIALAVVWGVADAIYLALAQTLAVSTDCAQTAFSNNQTASYPLDPTDGTTVVQGSSEYSVLVLIQQSGDTQTEINNVLNTVTVVGGQADTLGTAADGLNITLNDILTRITEVQDDTKLLKTNVDVLKNTETTILAKEATEVANLDTFQTLQLRMAIEENLSRNGNGSGPIGLYELPALYGGYLEVARSITTETITKETAVGHGNAQAATDLASANTAFTKKQWKSAYTYFCKAYQDVTK